MSYFTTPKGLGASASVVQRGSPYCIVPPKDEASGPEGLREQ